MDASTAVRDRSGVRFFTLVIVGCTLWLAGCVLQRGQSVVDRPVKHTVRTQRLVIHSDLPIGARSGIVEELASLRLDVLSTLALPESKRPVVLYLFQDERRYSEYMRQQFPRLPSRRAFFIGSPTELAVYAFHGQHLATDLRHEYTHGILHASLRHVPLWLDEGLAEYFEPERSSEHVNEEHLDRLIVAMKGGWQPDLERLEQLSDVSEMQAMDYHEAWAWIYTYLNAEEQDRQKLVSYVHTLRESQTPKRLSQVLGEPGSDAGRRLLKQIADLAPASSRLPDVVNAAPNVVDAAFAEDATAAEAKVEAAAANP